MPNKYVIMGVERDTHKRSYYNVLDSKWVEDESQATIFDNYNEGFYQWAEVSRLPSSRNMRVFLPNAKGGDSND